MLLSVNIMIKKLVCFDGESLKHLELLQALFDMNRSQLIRFLLRKKVQGIQETQFLIKKKGINQSIGEDIPKEKGVVSVEA